MSGMPAASVRPASPRWYFIPLRVLLLTFLLTLLSFAASLLLGILGTMAVAQLRGIHANLTTAYRHIALPVALGVAAAAAIVMTSLEIRNYRQMKALSEIARSSR